MKKLQLEQGSIEWHKFRQKHIGSSDAPIIMNVNPWTTPYQLWRHRMELDPPQQENERMRRGKELEPFARWDVSDQLGVELFPSVAEHDSISWMGASFDAIDNTGKTIVEIKCPGKEDHLQALNNVVPEKYMPQLQHQLEVSQLDFMYYFSFDGQDGKLLKAYRDDNYIKRMIEQEEKFWEFVDKKFPPPLGDRDFVQREDFQWIEGSKDWMETKKQLKLLEEKEAKQRQYLIQLAGNQNCKGNGVSLTKIVRKGTIDYERVPVLKGYDLEPYRKNNIETWRLGVN